jgi:hypothetical protein
MNDFLTLVIVTLLLAAAWLGASHLKVKGSTVIVHMLGSHRKGLVNPRLNRAVAQAVGAMTINLDVDGYADDHRLHHGLTTFARPDADPDAAFMHTLGLVPGTPVRVLWRRLAWALVSPVVHARMSATRLRGTFLSGPPGRRIFAAAWWSGLIVAAAAAGLLLPLVLGFIVPLLIAGNIGSLLELASEHRWNAGDEAGRERQFALSQGRYPGAMPPFGRGALAWAGRVLAMLGAAAQRIAVLPGDNPHHIFHHTGHRRAAHVDRHAWTNADLEYSPLVWGDEAVAAQSVASIREAIGRWFEALAARPVRT